MKCSENIDKLAGALSKAQGGYLPLAKDREVTVNGKSAAGNPITYKFKYATLDAVFDATRKALSDNGLCVVQPPTNSEHGILVTTRLIHESGQWIEEEFEFSTAAVKPQDLGGLISYAKRYSLSGLLGITADEDDDANSASGNNREFTPAAGKPRNGKPPVDRQKRGAFSAKDEPSTKGDAERADLAAPDAFNGNPSDASAVSPLYLKAEQFIKTAQGDSHWQLCRSKVDDHRAAGRITDDECQRLWQLIQRLESEDATANDPVVAIQRRLALCTTEDQHADVVAEIQQVARSSKERETLLAAAEGRLTIIEGLQAAAAGA